MKATWSIVQASGIAAESSLWQVRNPNEMLPNQERVFESDITVLKKTIDRNIIKKQIASHNYNGALVTFQASNLLKCASYRLTSAFEASFNEIKNYSKFCDNYFYEQSKKLAARQHQKIIKEIYFQAKIKAENKEYSELLVKIFVFQESVLLYMLKQKLLPSQGIHLVMNENLVNKLDGIVKSFEDGKLQQHLDNYRLHNGRKLVLTISYNRTVMTAIIEYFYDKNHEICRLLRNLDDYCQQRNDYIHQLKGISNLEADKILLDMKQILNLLNTAIKPNPFDTINQKIDDLLDAL